MVGTMSDRQSMVITVGVVGLLLSGVLVPAITGDASAQQTQPEPDNTITRIEVHENGSARWTIQIRTRLDTAERVDDYQAFQSRFEANKSRYLVPFRTRMQRVVANAANATGREMRAVEFTASTSIQEVPRRWGIVIYQFTWTNFAAQTDEALVVGDIFQGGFFLAANDTLAIAAPEGYEINRVEPAPASRDAGVISWVGREDFPDRHPHVAFAPRAGDGVTTSSSPASPADSPSAAIEGVSLAVLLGAGLLLLLLGATAYGVSRFRNDREPPKQPASSEDGQSDDGPAEVVMTDEELVRRLIEDHGGRIRQTTIADEFDWSASKTSRVIGRMVDEGTIEKLQLGRENLLELRDAEE